MLGAISTIVSAVSPLISEFVEDKDKAKELEYKLKELSAKQEHEIKMAVESRNLAQIEVNKRAAEHKSIFVAGGRSFIIWVCGFGLLYSLIVRDLLVAFLTFYDSSFSIPEVNTTLLTTVLMGILGLGGMRTFEKVKGVHTNNLKATK